MTFVPTALAVAVTVLAVPLLTGYATGAAATAPVASSFDASTITTLAANGIEQVATAAAVDSADVTLDAGEAATTARHEFGGDVRAAVLGPFTDHAGSTTRRQAWQVLLEDTVLPSGERGRAWVAVDASSGVVLSATPLLELDAD